ncbi:unnamed protein product [Hyaloperonospora brassicae]|uniref:RxLR effector candidate protein n=1 Tax=Hyaloperonospora brassicae TaxID=162125 RepID=A0AAV0UHM1_HYABA|nr:unnamed protein product [Hyaloperonospora brassicae]
MRVHPPFLLAAATIAMCTLSASVVIGSEMAKADRQTTRPSQVGGHNTVHDNQRLQTTHATDGEERAPLPSGASSSLEAQGEKLTMLLGELQSVANNAPVTGSRAALHALAVSRFEALAVPRFEGYDLVSETYPGLHKNGAKKFFRNVDDCYVVKTIQLFGKTITVRAPKDHVVARVRDPDAEKVFGEFKQAHPSPDLFQPSTLDLFENVVKIFNARHSKKYTLLDALVIVYEGEDNLAPALSKAKTVASSKYTAADLQEEMMTIWIREKRSAGDVFNILKLYELEARGLDRENLETFDAFLYLHRRIFFHHVRYRLQLDMVGFLRYKFGDTKLLQMIEKDMERSAYPKELIKSYVKLLRDHKISFRGIVGVFIDAGFADSTVVELMSEGYGGVAKFAQALSNAEADRRQSGFKDRIEKLQAALKVFLQEDKKKSSGDVNNLLEPSNHAESSRPSPSTDKESVRKRQKTK